MATEPRPDEPVLSLAAPWKDPKECQWEAAWKAAAGAHVPL
jgi:hypothetical protein